MSAALNAPSLGFADSSPAARWSILALRSSTAQRRRWIARGARRSGRSPVGLLEALP
jgi:hypothetical protein